MTVGIIGYGRFGKLAAKYIAERINVLVFDSRRRLRRFPSKRIRNATLEKVASQPIVLLAIPVSALEHTLHSITPHLLQSALVIDVCAVKELPLRWMRKILPRNVHILGSHPLFGPDSASDTLKGHRLVLCPERVPPNMLRQVVREIKGMGLAVQTMTPAKHDAMIAESLFLTQFVGRLVGKMNLSRHAFSTNSYRELMKIAKITDNDTKELFRDMFTYNPHAQRVLKRLMRSYKRVITELRKG